MGVVISITGNILFKYSKTYVGINIFLLQFLRILRNDIKWSNFFTSSYKYYNFLVRFFRIFHSIQIFAPSVRYSAVRKQNSCCLGCCLTNDEQVLENECLSSIESMIRNVLYALPLSHLRYTAIFNSLFILAEQNKYILSTRSSV